MYQLIGGMHNFESDIIDNRIPCTKNPLLPLLLKLNVSQYRSGNTVNVNCNAYKSNHTVISENSY